jgi:Flp pilus assembly protein TadG
VPGLALNTRQMKLLYSLMLKCTEGFRNPSCPLHVKKILHSRGGIIAVVFALAAIPIIMSIGGALDYGRAHVLKARLAEALDKAALAVGATTSTNPTTINDTLNNYFNANFDSTGVGRTLSISSNITDGTISLTATGQVDTTFLRIISINEIDVSVSTVVVRETTGLEVALVLDNTGSMSQNNRIGSLRVAASELVDILFQDEDTPETVRIALVPFVTTVNIGKDKEEDFVRIPSPPHDYPDEIDTSWKGCVEARNSPHDVEDTFQQDNNDFGEWDPYYWESEPLDVEGTTSFGQACQNTWWLPQQPLQPPVPVAVPTPLPTGRSGSTFLGHPNAAVPPLFELDVVPPFTKGPNKACPDPITPLTNNKTVLKNAINDMEPWSGNGTMAHLGAVWGWRVLSPEPPFDEGLPDSTEGNKKAVIILTDGRNLISSAGFNCRNFVNNKYTSHYSGYGYLSENRLGSTTFSGATNSLNNKLTAVCDNIKAAGITIYTITFELNDIATQNLFRDCASTPGSYFPSADSETLQESFRAIGAQLNSLRISQ